MSKNGFAPILVVVAVAIVAVPIALYLYIAARSNQDSKVVNQNTGSIEPFVRFPPPTTPSNEATPSSDISNWKTYINKKYKIMYPTNMIVKDSQGNTSNLENATKVVFDNESDGTGVSLPPYGISIISYSQATTKMDGANLSKPLLDDILSLPIGSTLTKEEAQNLAGDWNYKTQFTRLPNEIINGIPFIVFDNPEWYGGAHRFLFYRKGDDIYIIGGIYTVNGELNEFKGIYSSFVLQ